MSGEHQVNVVPLDKGLDLISPKPIAPPGSMLSCLNFETVDFIGARRIDGLTRYDGRVEAAQDSWFEIYSTAFGGDASSDFPVGSLIAVLGQDQPFGLVTDHRTDGSGQYILYARINIDLEPQINEDVVVLGTVTPVFGVSQAPIDGRLAAEDAEEALTSLNAYNTILRNRIEALHTRPHGLHWFRDRLYAVVDEPVVYFNSGSTEIKPNQYIKSGTAEGRVLHVVLESGTWSGGDAAGHIELEILDGVWGTSGEIDIYPDDTFTTPDTSNAATLTTGTEGPEYAGIWESRSESQAITDGDAVTAAGWNKKELGWEFTYEEGLAESGSFTRIQRGAENNFTFDADETSTTGDAGKWIDFKNGAIIGTDPAQGGASGTSVNNGSPGWKDTNDPNEFASDSTGLDDDDTQFLYGDMLFGTGRAINKINLPTYGYTANTTNVTFPTDLFGSNSRAPIILSNLGGLVSGIPDGSVIVGIQVELDYDTEVYYNHTLLDARGDGHDYAAPWIASRTILSGYLGNMNYGSNTFEPQGSKQTTAFTVESNPANYTQDTFTASSTASRYVGSASLTGLSLTLGNNGNIWGLGSISKEDFLNNHNFGIALFCDAQEEEHPTGPLGSYSSGGSSVFPEVTNNFVRMKMNRLRIKLYYQQPSVRYFFDDGAGNVCSADLVYYTVWEGDLTAGTAEGQMQVTNIIPVSGNKRTIEEGDTMHIANPTSTANRVATIASDMVVNGIPTLADITAEDSRYLFITANFFGDEAWDAFYGVSGAGRALSYDGEYFIKIYTQEDADKDMPRHIAYHSGYLALGFRSGSVQFSALGEPELYGLQGALQGAAERPQGDRITGLLPLNGMTLAVFCENSIRAISGSVSTDFADQVLSPTIGALEYTVVNMGKPVFCTPNGISTMDQTASYGDFVGQRLSYPISPWIIPRMVRNTNLFSIQNAAGVVCAIPVRSKNQYRLFFRDGNILTMTLNGPSNQPTFTFQKYLLNQESIGDDSDFIVPVAWSSQVDDRGLERIHVSHYSPLSDLESNYVYELEKGWSFDGQYIPHYLETNWYFPDGGGATYTGIDKVRIHGLSKGLANIKVAASGIDDQYVEQYDESEEYFNLPRNTASSLTTDFKPATDIVYLSNRGLSIQLKFEGNGTLTIPEPSYVLQVLNVFSRTGGKVDG